VSQIPSLNGKRFPVLSGTVLVNFSRNRKAKAAAEDFIFWLLQKENDVLLFEKIGFLPARRSTADSLEVRAFVQRNPSYRVPIEALEYARPLPVHPEFFKVNQEIRDMLQRIILQGADPMGELVETEKKINAMLE
jgi:sn-glycerol 3-phosphate transport system substrate-binding protein